jgi:hypothetical protein
MILGFASLGVPLPMSVGEALCGWFKFLEHSFPGFWNDGDRDLWIIIFPSSKQSKAKQSKANKAKQSNRTRPLISSVNTTNVTPPNSFLS